MTTQDTTMELANMLDTMADYFLAKKEIEFSDCVQDWYRNKFQCNLVPMPNDKDEFRLAVKASIMERLVEVLNAPPRSGNQIAPAWCAQIKAVSAPVKLQSERLLEDERYCQAFAKRNLHVTENFMYFV